LFLAKRVSMKFLLLVVLFYLLPSSESRLVAFCANSSHIVTYEASPDGALSFLSIQSNPSSSPWLSVWPLNNPSHLLSTGNPNGTGSILLYSINGGNGQLTQLAVQNSSGNDPAYVSWDVQGNWGLIGNYGGGNLKIYPIDRISGTLGLGMVTSQGGNAHMITTDFSNQFVFVTNLGQDRTYQYLFGINGSLTPNTVPFVTPSQPGSGPRHFALHPDHEYAYVLNEKTSNIDVYLYDSNQGSFTSLVQTISTLPSDWSGNNTGAEIIVASDGKFLYASNRGHNSIVGYEIDPANPSLHLKAMQWSTYHISTPRNFAIDPTGSLLLVGASVTSEIVAFNIGVDGLLYPSGEITSMSAVTSIVICEIS